MAKRNTPTLSAPKEGAVTIPVSFKVFQLLQDGKINAILTKEQLTKQPRKIDVICTAISDTTSFMVESMMSVFHGYRPEGYPEDEASRGKSLCLTLAPMAEELQPLEAPHPAAPPSPAGEGKRSEALSI